MSSFPYIQAINVIPASGEFVYDSVSYSAQAPNTTGYAPINTYYAGGGTKTDFSYALDQIQAQLPNCTTIALVVQWMGNTLSPDTCQLYCSTTYWFGTAVGAFKPTAGGTDSWRVSDCTLADCNNGLIPIPRPDGVHSMYGGTCSDQSVVRAIQAIKARGLKVAFYFQMNMSSSGQPWRGLCVYPADVSSAATAAVTSLMSLD